MGTVTLKDLAKELNLSINTVSRALRDMPDIGKETKEIVRKAAESMNYRTNLNAAALRTNLSKTIGAVVSDISNPVFAGMIKGISVKCREAGYTMLLANTSENYDEEQEAVKSMLRHKVDGIILFPSMKGKSPVQELLAKKIPFILVGRYFSDLSTNVVINDDVLGGNIAAEHLYGRGHRSFLYIAGSLQISSSRERLEGFRQYLETKGLGPECITVYETDATWRGGYTTMKNIISETGGGAQGLRKTATAIFAFSDFVAIGVLKALRDSDIKVPEDMALIGYDDIDFCELTVPELTTVDLSKFRLGRRATELLIQEINSGVSKERRFRYMILEPRLIVRKST